MLGVGSDLCGSSSPTPPARQGHLQLDAQDLFQAGLEYKKEKPASWDNGSLTGQQMKRTITTIILIRKIYKINSGNAQGNSHCPMPSVLLSHG